MPQSIITNNMFQNIGSARPDRATMPGNFSLVNPTVEQLNDSISGGQSVVNRSSEPEPAFGVHIREAVCAVRRVFS
jgi:hypothetical protein